MSRSNRSKRRTLGISAILVILGLTTVGCRGSQPERRPPRPPLVEAVQARSGALPLEDLVFGVVRAENQVAIRPEISARVSAVLVDSGATVRRGQELVRLHSDELVDRLRIAEADVRSAEAEAAEAEARSGDLEVRAKRLQRLADDDLVSEQELDSIDALLVAARAAKQAAEARVEQSRATADERRTALAKTVVRAPVAGRVGERMAEVGMQVDPGTLLFRVGNLDRVTVHVTLSEAMLADVRPGQPAIVRPRGVSATAIEGTLVRISPFLDERSFTTTGEIDLDNRDGALRPGMFVDVTIRRGDTDEATLIPTSALWEDPRSGERGVFVVREADGLQAPLVGRAENPDRSRLVAFRPVRLLAEGRGRIGIEGIEPGDWVVIAGQHLLRRAMQDGTDAATAAPGAVDTAEARIRPTDWERVAALQELQREDLLEGFLDKQRRIARVLGAEIPASEAEVERALAAAPEPR